MSQSNQYSHLPPATFGFITVVEVPSLGHCGGLLVVSSIGRPIEFHFTTPVSSNRAQEIMYGKTYPGFLYGDRIGAALVDKTKQLPTVFVTDCPDMLPVCELIDTPLILVLASEEPTDKSSQEKPFDGRGLKHFEVNGQTIYCLNATPEKLGAIEYQAGQFSKTLPFEEPFERIRQAIFEANQVLKSA